MKEKLRPNINDCANKIAYEYIDINIKLKTKDKSFTTGVFIKRTKTISLSDSLDVEFNRIIKAIKMTLLSNYSSFDEDYNY